MVVAAVSSSRASAGGENDSAAPANPGSKDGRPTAPGGAGKTICEPVTDAINSSGLATAPMSRWWRTIALRVNRAGHRRNLKVFRVRHHSTRPVSEKANSSRPSTPVTHRPLSPSGR